MLDILDKNCTKIGKKSWTKIGQKMGQKWDINRTKRWTHFNLSLDMNQTELDFFRQIQTF